MTKPLPRPDVQVNPRRLGPARLTAPERQALARVEDPSLRKVLGEVFLQSRAVQSNFDAIREWFPIQPEDAADALREGGSELPIENQGDLIVGDESGEAAVLPVGDDGQTLVADSGEPLGMRWTGPVSPTPGNEGEELSAGLAQWVKVHEHLQTVPDDNQEVWSRSYTPSSDTEFLVVVWVQFEKGAGVVKPTFTGAGAPDWDDFTGLGIGTTTIGIRIWKAPGPGTISVTLEGNNTSYMFLPISVKSQGGEPLTRHQYLGGTDTGSVSEETKNLNIELPLPGLFISASVVFQNATDFSTARTGTRVLKKQNDAEGANNEKRFEVCVGLQPSGASGVAYTFAPGAEAAAWQATGIVEE